MGVARLSLVVVFSFLLVLSLGVFFEPAEAKKSAGTYLTEIGSKQVCGDKLCAAPLSIEEKINAFLVSKGIREGDADQQIGRFSEGGVSQQKAPDKEPKGKGGPREKIYPYQTLEWKCINGKWWAVIYEWTGAKKKSELMRHEFGSCSSGSQPPTTSGEMLFSGGQESLYDKRSKGPILERTMFAVTKFPNVEKFVGEQFTIETWVFNFSNEVITVKQENIRPKDDRDAAVVHIGFDPSFGDQPFGIDPKTVNPLKISNDWRCQKLTESTGIGITFTGMPNADKNLPEDKRRVLSIDNTGLVKCVNETPPSNNSGKISFDSDTYQVAGTVIIELQDQDLNIDADLIDVYQAYPNDTSPYTSYIHIGTDTDVGRLLDVTFDDELWTSGDCGTPPEFSDGLDSTGFTLVETERDSGSFLGNFQIPDTWCTDTNNDGVGDTITPTYGIDLEVNYLDFQDASGGTIEVTDSAVVRANTGSTGSVELDRTVYPVPFGDSDDFADSLDIVPSGRSIFPIHSTGIDSSDGLDVGETLGVGDLIVHVRINDPDFDLSPIGEDSIAANVAGTAFGPVKISIIRGSDTVILGYSGGPDAIDGLIHVDADDAAGVIQFGPILETAPDSGIFEQDFTIRYTDGPASTTCPVTTDYDGSGGDSTTRFDGAAGDYCILKGDILQVEYTDSADASGNPNTVTDSATFDLRNGVLQTDKSVYIIGGDLILTLIEPDLDLDPYQAETWDLDLIEWESDAVKLPMGNLGGEASNFGEAFNPEPSDLRETGPDTGIFQVVIEIPAELGGNPVGGSIIMEYEDWGPNTGNFVGEDVIDVSGSQVNITPPETQNYGIASIQWLNDTYPLHGTGGIQIIDNDSNENPTSIDVVFIDVTSKSDTDGITLEVQETAPDSGIFETDITFIEDATGENSIQALDLGWVEVVLTDETTPSTVPSPHLVKDVTNIFSIFNNTGYDISHEVLSDPSGHYEYIAPFSDTMIVLEKDDEITFLFSTGFVNTEGTTDGENFTTSGVGTVAGISNIKVEYNGVKENDSITGTYVLGKDGGLPGGDDIAVTLFTANFGSTIELDEKVYSWTDKVFVTIVAPDHNFDNDLIDEIGNSSVDPIKISTRGHDLENYRLVETGPDTGIFTGEILLTGFPHDADGDGDNDTTPSTGGVGPTGGSIETDKDDELVVSFEFSEDETIVGSALIRWNIGEVQWLEASYPASGTGVVRVVDPDMNLNPDTADNFDVDVWSDSDAGGIDLTVTETNEATGIFEGTVFFTVTDESSGSSLRVAEGDTVVTQYEDNTLPDPYTTADELDITATSLIGTVVPP